MPGGAASPDVPEMLRNMLASRHGMTYHTETRVLPTAILTLGKGGLKARLATQDDKRSFRNLPEPAATHNELPLTAKEFAEWLTGLIKVPVIDETSLRDRYMFIYDVYRFGRGAPDANGFTNPIFEVDRYNEAFTSIGLRLEYKKAPLEAVVIDGLAREPSEN
jgi:uncharacterized protein (TIGR03435 family)